MELKVRLAALDLLDQVATWQTRVILWHDGLIVKQEDYTLLERFYFRNQLVAMLAIVGFRDIDVLGDYTEDKASPESGIVIHIARK